MRLFKLLNITEIHTHSLVDYESEAPEHLLAVVTTLGIRWQVTFMIIRSFAPTSIWRTRMVSIAGNRPTMSATSAWQKGEIGFSCHRYRSWREMHRRVLLAADRVLVPDQDIAERLKRYFPETIFDVSPHEEPFPAQAPVRISRSRPEERLRIIVIGAIGKIKGFNVLFLRAKLETATITT